MDNLFNENMTSYEARTVLFSSVDGKSKEEIEEIKKQYKKVSEVIFKREMELASQGWVFG